MSTAGDDDPPDDSQPPAPALVGSGSQRPPGPGGSTAKSPSRAKRPPRSQSSQRKKPKTGRRTLWDTDGPNDSVSSLSVLLDWLTEEGNYTKWRGGDKHNGDTKTALATEISERIRVNGIVHRRKPKDIVTKIGLLEQSFRAASDFLANTGAGITNEASLQAAIEDRCPHYNLLKDVMVDKPSTRPLLTTEDVAFLEGAEDSAPSEPDGVEHDATAGQHSTSVPTRGSGKRVSSIRPPASRSISAAGAWSDFNSAYAAVKEQERESTREMHGETLALQREQMQQKAQVELRRVACSEEESRCRVMLLQAQAERERLQTKKEEIALRMELARCRKQLREEGMTEEDINEILPIH